MAFECGKMVMDLLKRDLRPRQIITRKSLENAIAAVATTGGSTNAVLHLLAIAREANIKLSIDDFDKINRKVPLLADLKPGGRFTASDLYAAGGTTLVAKRLLDAGILHAGQPTVTGRTIGEEAKDAKETSEPTSSQAPLEPDQADRRAGDFTGKPRSGGLCREGGRTLDHDVPRPGESVRPGRGRLCRRAIPSDQGRRCRGHSV